MSLFPVAHDNAASPAEPNAAAGGAPMGVQGGFSSFNAAAFLQEQQKPSSVAQQGLSAEELNRAIDYYMPSSSESEDDEDDADAAGQPAQPAPGPAPAATTPGGGSSDSEASAEERRSRKDRHRSKRKRKKEKHHKERKRAKTDAEKVEELERHAAAQGDLPRRSQPQQWAGTTSGQPEQPYYIDAQGDRNNVVYGSLYRMDLAAYSRHDPLKTATGAKPRFGYAYGYSQETDGQSQRGAAGRRQRYFLAKQVRKEHDGGVPRIRYRLIAREVSGGRGGSLALPPPVLLPLQADGSSTMRRAPANLSVEQLQELQRRRQQQQQRQQQAEQRQQQIQQHEQQESLEAADAEPEGETEAAYLMRRAKEFNVATRERPGDLQLWLDFAAFQDEALASGTRGRASAEAALAEKKIAILERALQHHPASDTLLLELLRLTSSVGDHEQATDRWRDVLRAHSGRPALWRAYLAFRRAHFGSYTARKLRHLHDDAMDAIARERVALQAAGGSAVEMAALEQNLIALLCDAVAADLASGHTELAVARLQAALEYNCFAPPIFANDAEKLEAFRDFWDSGDPLIGDESGLGWLQTISAPSADSMPTAATKKPGGAELQEASEAAEPEPAGGGWTGWQATAGVDDTGGAAELTADAADTVDAAAAAGEPDDADADGDEEDAIAEAAALEGVEETEEELMARLGLKLEEQLAELDADAGVPPAIAKRWAATEAERSAQQWHPVRSGGGGGGGGDGSGGTANGADSGDEVGSGDHAAPDDAAAKERVVRFADLEDSLFTLATEGARQQLALRACALLGAPLPPHFCSSNAPGADHAHFYATSLASGLGATAPLMAARWQPDACEPLSWGLLGATQLDERLRWLLPGGSARPWFAQTPSRRAFLARLMTVLLEAGPLQGHRGAALAWLAVEAAPATAFAFSDDGGDDAPADPPAGDADAAAGDGTAQGGASGAADAAELQPDWDRARAAAQALLSRRRESAPLFGAYAALEAAAGQHKAARRAYDAALAAAATALNQALAGGPPVSEQHERAAAAALAVAADIAVAYAEMEMKRGGKDAIPRALHCLAWLGAGAPDFVPYSRMPSKGAAGAAVGSDAGQLQEQQLLAARRGLQDWIGHALGSAQLAGSIASGSTSDAGSAAGAVGTSSDSCSGSGHANAKNARGGDVETEAGSFDVDALEGGALAPLVAAAALLEELLPAAAPGLVLGGSAAGVRNASRIYSQVAEAVPGAVQRQSAALEGLAVRQCRLLLAECLAGSLVATPRLARSHVQQALTLWPRNAELLAMLAEAGEAARATARLRRDLAAAREAAACPAAWLLSLRAEALRPGGGLTLQTLFERLLADAQGGGACPLLWRAYLAYELGRGRPQAARRVYLRAVHACPGAAELWRDGFASLGEALAAAEAAELLELAADKGIALRTDVYEVKLAVAGEAAGLAL